MTGSGVCGSNSVDEAPDTPSTERAYSEPRDYQTRQAEPSKPVTVIRKKRSFAGLVGALLGRKTEEQS